MNGTMNLAVSSQPVRKPIGVEVVSAERNRIAARSHVAKPARRLSSSARRAGEFLKPVCFECAKKSRRRVAPAARKKRDFFRLERDLRAERDSAVLAVDPE